jgi:hypothetical protein
MIKVNESNSVKYLNEYDYAICWENKEEQWFDFRLLKNNKLRFYLNQNKNFHYYDQNIKIIKTGIEN